MEGLKIPEEKKRYIVEKLNPILEEMVTECLTVLPKDPISFMTEYLLKKDGAGAGGGDATSKENQALKEELEKLTCQVTATTELITSAQESSLDRELKAESSDEDDDVVDEIPDNFKMPEKNKGARSSVSAEAYGAWNQKVAFTPPVHAKSDEQKTRLKATLGRSFMFSALEESETNVLVDAMEEVKPDKGARPINQGDDGDFLYVTESGKLQCFCKTGDEETMVREVQAGDAFGELALLYNCPRAASVEVAEDGTVLWKLDRGTFNHVVKDAASRKRELYENFLKGVTLLSTMDQYQRSQVADALKAETVEAGTVIMKENEPGDKFYILENGQAKATKGEGGEAMTYNAGDYFGELALIWDQPRAATVTAETSCKLLALDRSSFKRLLGSLDDVMKEKQYS